MAGLSQPLDVNQYLNGMLEFIKNSPTPYHASQNLCALLDEQGFRRLTETEEWHIQQGDQCYVTRNGTSVIAFRFGSNSKITHGMRLVGAHLDSPCLKLNPGANFEKHGYRIANVEVYGSSLLRTWFDRDLAIAGRIFVRNADGSIRNVLVDSKAPVAVIPSIAIHLERQANKLQEIDSQVHINPVLLNHSGDNETLPQQLLNSAGGQVEVDGILGFDLRFYDANPPNLIGSEGETSNSENLTSGCSNQYISSARIDNLLSCYAGVQALFDASDDNFCMLVASDHEEVGSVSDSGAQGRFLLQVLERIGALDPRVNRNSAMLSADGAHGLHPNYPEKHDEQHRPVLNNGPVIKVNSNQRYATSDETEAVIRGLCTDMKIPVQVFVSRNDQPCGTTIGPLVASEIGIRTVDVGVAQFAMHSIRELAGCDDAVYFLKLLKAFYESDSVSLVD